VIVEVLVPRLNANEDEVKLIDLLVSPGENVRVGQPIAQLETTKSIVTLESEHDGSILVIHGRVGDMLPVGTALLTLVSETAAQSSGDAPRGRAGAATNDAPGAESAAERGGAAPPAEGDEASPRRQTAKARLEERRAQREQAGAQGRAGGSSFADSSTIRVLIIGAGHGCQVVMEFLRFQPNVQVIGILDDNQSQWGREIGGVPVLGGTAYASELVAHGFFDRAIISITSNMAVRRRIFEELRARGVSFINAIHPRAFISPSAEIGEGNIVAAFVHIGAAARVGDDNLISAHSSIEHHNVVGSHNLFGPAVATSGDVRIGDGCIFGAGVHMEPHLTIGDGARVATGQAVVANIAAGVTVKARMVVQPRAADAGG
jgi:sugar O-acyltransferase (sialic acid O-acetyltransferase NeuD family)